MFLWGEKSVLLVVAVAGMLAMGGCVSEKLEPEYSPQLGMSQSSDGLLVLMLKTEVGYKYTIRYEDPRTQTWKPLKGCEAIKGTGEAIEIKKKIDPRKPVPRMTVDYSKL